VSGRLPDRIQQPGTTGRQCAQADQRSLDVYNVKHQVRMLRMALESGGLTKEDASVAAVAARRLETKLRELLPAEA
jgi:hypothetical protein